MPTKLPIVYTADALTSDFFDGETLATTSEASSTSFVFPKGRGVVFYIYSSSESGTLKIDVILGSTPRQLLEQVINADELTVIDFDFYIPAAQVRFTPDAAPTTLTIKAYGYPVG